MTDSETCAREPRWQRRPEDRPEEILAAALAVFSEQGYARARLEDVASRAGVSKGTLYLYFDSKEALFRAMVREHVVGRLECIEARVAATSASATDTLRDMMATMWRALHDSHLVDLTRLVHGELGHFPELAHFYFEEVIFRARRIFDAVIQRGVEQGEFRPVRNGFATRGIHMLMIQAAQVQSFFAAYDPDALTDEQVLEGATDLLLNGLVSCPDSDR